MIDSGSSIKLLKAQTYHGRKGIIRNPFRYRLDLILVPVAKKVKSPTSLLKINGTGLFSIHSKDYGDGIPFKDFAEMVANKYNFASQCDGPTYLLTQPRFLGYSFNPVSFWFFCSKDGSLRVALAEVSNTNAERHIYLCHHDDFAVIKQSDRISAQKIFYVSPFQEVLGTYEFRFKVDSEQIGVWVDHQNGDEGVYTTLTGKIRALTFFSILRSAVTRPFGAFRVIALIHWQALKLKFMGAKYRKAPKQNPKRTSR